MNIYAISDLHLCISGAKPMDVFGIAWENYLEKIKADWQQKVKPCDYVLLAGDLSWAMKIEDALKDIEYLCALNGTKVITRGNHDYWWKSYSVLKQSLPSSIIPLQNNAIRVDGCVICGTRGWTVPERNAIVSDEDKKIYNRELIRLELSLKSAQELMQQGDKLIVMIHFPPFNSHIDNSDFTDLMERYHVDKVVYGHLHGKKVRVKELINKNSVDYILTSCDLVNNTLIKIL